MGEVRAVGLHKRYGRTVGIEGVDFAIDEGEFFVILGPSGAGKTTTLKGIAGLVDLDDGEVHIGGRDVTRVEPYHRNVAMAFESYALYPQKTVAENLASPLRSGRTGAYDPAEQQRRIEAVTTTLGIAALRDRYPRELSNGQRQRTALGRVLVRPADAYLLDEPLSHLDAKLRSAMRSELKSLADTSSTTTLYVTHDYQEALALGDRIAVLRDGHVVQIGTPMQMWRAPVDTFVAKTLGQPEINLFDAEVIDGRLRAAQGAIDLAIPPDLDVTSGDRVRIGLRPRDLEIVTPHAPGRDGLELTGEVLLAERLGRSVELTVRVGDVDLIAVTGSGDLAAEGHQTRVRMPLTDMHVFAGAAAGEDSRRLGGLVPDGAGAPDRAASAQEPR